MNYHLSQDMFRFLPWIYNVFLLHVFFTVDFKGHVFRVHLLHSPSCIVAADGEEDSAKANDPGTNSAMRGTWILMD